MRSADIAANCREVALRVEISGEWGELADTLRAAAAEVENARAAAESLRQDNARLRSDVDLLRKLVQKREVTCERQ